MIITDGTFGKGLGPELDPHEWDLCPSQRTPESSLVLCSYGADTISQKSAAWMGALTGSNPAGTLISGFQPPGLGAICCL